MRWRAQRVVAQVLAALALLLLSGTAYAAPGAQESEARVGFFGEVTLVGPDQFEVSTRNGPVTLMVTGETQFNAPGQETAAFADLVVGQRVAVLAMQGDTAGTATALRVMLVPTEPQRLHLTVTVVERQGNVVIGRDRQGNEVRIEVSAGELEEEGKVVTIVGTRGEREREVKARAVVDADKVIERLEKALQEAKERAEREREEQAEDKREEAERRLAELQARLEANMQRHLEKLATVVERLPEEAKAKVEAAIERQRTQFVERLERLGEAREQVLEKVGVVGVAGRVKEVGAEEGVLVVHLEGRDGDLRVQVTAETTIELDGQAAGLADLQPGDLVRVRLDVSTRAAVHISASTQARAAGVVREVDAATPALILRTRGGDDLRVLVTAETSITLNEQPATLEELQAGMPAHVVYNSRDNVALGIAAQALLEVEGELSAVDASSGFLVVTTEEGETLELRVTPHTHVQVNGVLGLLVDLPTGVRVAAVYDARTKEVLKLHVRLAERRERRDRVERVLVSGVIREIDKATPLLMLAAENGTTYTFAIVPDTKVLVGRHEGTLEDLTVGARAKVAGVAHGEESDRPIALAIYVEGDDDDHRARRAELKGTVRRVDLHEGVLVVGEVTLRVSSNTRVELAGRLATTADLREGARVYVVYDRESETVVLVHIEPAEKPEVLRSEVIERALDRAADVLGTSVRVLVNADFEGVVLEAHEARRALVVRTPKGSVAVLVRGETKITVNGEPADLTVLRRGMTVRVETGEDGSALLVEARAAIGDLDGDGRPDVVQVQRLQGVVAELDANAGVVVLRTLRGTLKVQIGGSTRVLLDGNPVTMTRLERGMVVVVALGADGSALAIEARSGAALGDREGSSTSRLVGGRVVEVHAEERVLVVQVPGADQVKVTVARDARIAINGRAATLADIQSGMVAQVELNADGVAVRLEARTTVVSEATPRPTLSDSTRSNTAGSETRVLTGTVAEVNADRGVVVVRTASGLVTVTVQGDARVTLNGTAVGLGLLVGATVEVEVDSNGNAVRVEAKVETSRTVSPSSALGGNS